jgi:hypothetical protein
LATLAGSVATMARLSWVPRVIAVFSHWRVSMPVTSAVLTATVRPLAGVSGFAVCPVGAAQPLGRVGERLAVPPRACPRVGVHQPADQDPVTFHGQDLHHVAVGEQPAGFPSLGWGVLPADDQIAAAGHLAIPQRHLGAALHDLVVDQVLADAPAHLAARLPGRGHEQRVQAVQHGRHVSAPGELERLFQRGAGERPWSS